ncbi:ABC transporter permease [Ilumatobacter nonamiensis]|uniref:ABC transporter permease n=1 Tax=Ilumatobacter nonamiensis TaxID=467093 RepID=UPI00034A98D0|nr:ABC transporter permease [Ilumatobacter nonamiensis]
MLKFIARRLVLGLITLAILLVIITLIPNIAPGDPARKIAGGTATPERLAQVNESLGLRDPVSTQLTNLGQSVFTLDFGESFSVAAGQPVMDLVFTALGNSAKLVALSLIIMVPLAILGGLVAAYKKDTWIDRTIVNTGLAFSSIPDFVAGVFLLAFLAVPFEFFKVQANAPPGSSILVQIQHLLLPAIAVLMVYFGYIARITRAGTITSLDADYTRTAFMRGLTTREVFRKHVARNALQPTVAVLGTQLGYLFGGMVALEIVFQYPGLGNLIIRAVDRADYPVLRAGVLTVAIIYMLATLAADLLIAWMNPRARLNIGEDA